MTEAQNKKRGLDGPRIVVDYWAKPIPDRRFDWSAVFDNYEPDCPIGFGRTESEAITDLMEQVDE